MQGGSVPARRLPRSVRPGRRVVLEQLPGYGGQHPIVLATMHEAVSRVGTGAGGTRNISDNTRDHVLLERELADLHGQEAALVFATGYVTNEAALSTLTGLIPECIVYSDVLNHASMIAGIRPSRANKRIFRHNDTQDFEHLMAADDPSQAGLLRERLLDGCGRRPGRGNLRLGRVINA